MSIDSIVTFWIRQTHTDSGIWVHPEDEDLLSTECHSFNLDYPAGGFVGDILNAPVIILGANGGYDPEITSGEFSDKNAIQSYLARISSPSTSDWSEVSPYYDDVNYSDYILEGNAVLVNACAYRSPSISKELDNQELIERLSSVAFTRSWLTESVIPLALAGKRFIVANRHRYWKLTDEIKALECVVMDPAPVSKHLSKTTLQKVNEFLANYTSDA